MLNLNIMLRNFLATLRRKLQFFSNQLRLKWKMELPIKNQNVYLYINIYLNQASTLQFRSVLSLYRNRPVIYGANQWDGFYIMPALDWNKLILTTTFSIYYFSFHEELLLPQVSNLTRYTFHKSIKPRVQTIARNNFMFFWILIKLNFIPSLLRINSLLFRWDLLAHTYATFVNDNFRCSSHESHKIEHVFYHP